MDKTKEVPGFCSIVCMSGDFFCLPIETALDWQFIFF